VETVRRKMEEELRALAEAVSTVRRDCGACGGDPVPTSQTGLGDPG
jgi:hypothetical protein